MKILVSKIILVLILAISLVSCAKKTEPLKMATVEVGTIRAEIPTTGIVEPRNRLEIKPPIAGRVEQVLVREGQTVAKGQILAWLSSNERAALLDAARAKGEEEVKKWEDVYKPTPIVSPLNGFIIQRSVEPGQTITTGDALLVMADYLIVKAQVDETDIGSIKVGQLVNLELDAYPDKEISGKVGEIAYESTVVNNVNIYQVKVVPGYVPDYFRAGMSATVNFIQQEKKDVLLVPVNVVQKYKNNSYVFLPKGEDKVKPEQIQVGLENTSHIEVVSGLSAGDKVVIPTQTMIDTYLNKDQRRRGPMNPFSKREK